MNQRKTEAQMIVAKLRRLYDGGHVRPSEIPAIAVHLGYRRTAPQLGPVEWLASMLATAGLHPSMPASFADKDGARLTYKNGDLVPANSTDDLVAESVNRVISGAICSASNQ